VIPRPKNQAPSPADCRSSWPNSPPPLHAAEQARDADRDRARELERAHRAELHDRDAALAAAGAEQHRRVDQLRAEHQQAIAAL
jgi:hypothetical protein